MSIENKFILITVFILISVWNGIHADGAYGTGNHISVNVGDNVTLDCDMTARGLLQYPVYWGKDGMSIATKYQNGRPFIVSTYSHLSYTVEYCTVGVKLETGDCH